jgi:hypothetical protein
VTAARERSGFGLAAVNWAERPSWAVAEKLGCGAKKRKTARWTRGAGLEWERVGLTNFEKGFKHMNSNFELEFQHSKAMH